MDKIEREEKEKWEAKQAGFCRRMGWSESSAIKWDHVRDEKMYARLAEIPQQDKNGE